jgi:hypothetical protein
VGPGSAFSGQEKVAVPGLPLLAIIHYIASREEYQAVGEFFLNFFEFFLTGSG